MFPIKSLRRLVLVLGFVGVIGGVYAEEVAEPKSDFVETRLFRARTFATEIRPGEVAGWEQVRRVLVSVGTNDFGLVASHGYRISTSDDKLTLISPDGNYFLTFRVLVTQASDANSVAAGRRHLLNEYPQAKITEEYSKVAAGNSGPVFALRGKISGKVDRALRVALIPCRAGVLEFTLNADVPKAAEGETAFNAMLRNFRSNERGKFDVVVRTLDRS